MTTRIAFLAITQAHQYLHWLPAALRLALEPDVEVTVLGSSAAGLEFIRSYDPGRRLRYERLWAPALQRDGLFSPPRRRLALLLNYPRFRRFPTLVTTEVTSSLLYRLPGFKSRIVHLKHGAGDREGGFNPKHARFDLTLVNGRKHKQALIDRGLTTDGKCSVVGYAKFELIRPPAPIFPGNKPLALYNPHFDAKLSSWLGHASEMLQAMESIPEWNLVIAPHVKMRDAAPNASAANILFDPGSVRSIDMSYTEAADVYIGDVSSQVYEFLRRPRPCIFVNLDRRDWRNDPHFMHWHLGQVIESPNELATALSRAHALQPSFEEAQRRMAALSIDPSPEPASERQARAILAFARGEAIL